MDKKPNVIWIIGEAIRNYPTKGQYGRFSIFDKLACEGTLFNNMVTRAPSTIMSQSSMLTGIPTTYLSRTFVDFNFDKVSFPSVSSILKEFGYQTYAALFHAEGYNAFNGLVPLLDGNNLPLNMRNDHFWSSTDIDNILDHLLKKGMQEPFCLILNYNNVTQEDTNEIIEKGITKLKEAGIYDDAIVLFSPDHGCPDYERNKMEKIAHQMVLTNANILIPFFIRWPGCPQKIIQRPISTVDMLPTLLELLQIPSEKYNLQGQSFLPLITGVGEYTRDKFRVDTKYLFQENRGICIYNNNNKYILHPDKLEPEEFYDLCSDQNEENNVVGVEKYSKVLNEFRDEFEKTEKNLIDFQVNYLKKKIEEKLSNLSIQDETKDKKIEIFLLGSGHSIFINSILEAINSEFNNYHVDLVAQADVLTSGLRYEDKVTVFSLDTKQVKYSKDQRYVDQLENPLFSQFAAKVSISHSNIDSNLFIQKYSKLCKKNYHIAIIPLDNPFGVGQKSLFKIVKKLKTKEAIYIDYNADLKKPSNWFIEGFRLVSRKRNYYMKDPRRLVMEIGRYLKEVKKRGGV